MARAAILGGAVCPFSYYPVAYQPTNDLWGDEIGSLIKFTLVPV